ncbi:MAG: hypothetical protein CVV41_14310 [Candidatus Riflebacteria bacterium HGW-Riflebacteria-1]|nr:MAG: hypothetical protein CVV41_14310 [Candidatus Riflebacteria bacterium HGW-Riflebacteria-1]
MIERKPLQTMLFCLICAATYFWVAGQSTEPITFSLLMNFGAAYAPKFLSGDIWRFFTHNLLHLHLSHLLLNLLFLFLIGKELEKKLEPLEYSGILIFSMYTCGIAGLWFEPLLVMVGSSGIMFGVFAAYFVFSMFEKEITFRTRIRKLLEVSILIYISDPQFWKGFERNEILGMGNPVSHAGHLGGFIGGLLFTAMIIIRRAGWLKTSVSRLFSYSILLASILVFAESMYLKTLPEYNLPRFESLYSKGKDLSKVIAEVEILEKQLPEFYGGYAINGHANFRLANYASAAAKLEIAHRLNPENLFIRYFKLFTDYEMGKNEEIIADALKFCKDSPNHATLIYPLLVLINVRAGNLKEAKEFYQKEFDKSSLNSDLDSMVNATDSADLAVASIAAELLRSQKTPAARKY